MFGFGMLLGPIALALIAYVIYYAVTGSSRQCRIERVRDRKALEILKQRYARGEISRTEYLKIREELET